MHLTIVGWLTTVSDPDIEMVGGWRESPKTFFGSFGPQFGLKIRRAATEVH